MGKIVNILYYSSIYIFLVFIFHFLSSKIYISTYFSLIIQGIFLGVICFWIFGLHPKRNTRISAIIICLLFLVAIFYVSQSSSYNTANTLEQGSFFGSAYSDEKYIEVNALEYYKNKRQLGWNLYTCSNIEYVGQNNGISDPKSYSCRELCGLLNKEYRSYRCEKDALICRCLIQ